MSMSCRFKDDLEPWDDENLYFGPAPLYSMVVTDLPRAQRYIAMRMEQMRRMAVSPEGITGRKKDGTEGR